MPPRPFPFLLGIGTDIVNTNRFVNIIRKGGIPGEKPATKHFFRLLRKVLTYKEQVLFWQRFKDVGVIFGDDEHTNVCARYLAGRWAAKEAVIKAVKPRKLVMSEILILNRSELGDPYAVILNRAEATTLPESKTTKSGTSVEKQQITQEVLQERLTMSPAELSARNTTNAESVAEEDMEQPAELTDRPSIETDDIDGQIAHISISHDTDYCIAVCMAASDPGTGDVGGEAAAREHT
ncbi:hypothetical protein LTR50_000876 [Elasticomyces elasticus]|nr:hypothetical protein LTR50_000876 [Elasticomyces elasticus]